MRIYLTYKCQIIVHLSEYLPNPVLLGLSKPNLFDISETCKNAIEFMEKTTAIKAIKDGNYFGAILFTQKNLDKWK